MKARRILSTAGALSVSALLLLGCRAEEQGRITRYEPGVYKGKPDTQLSAAQTRQLRQRTVYQGSGVSTGGGSAAPKRDVRRPGASGIDLGKLKLRARNQGGN